MAESEDPSYTRLRQLQTISEAALAHLRFDELLDELLRRVVGVLRTDTAAVLMLDEERGELVARAAKGLEEEVHAGVRIPLGRGFAGRIAAERRAIKILDVAQAEIQNPILREKGLQSLLGAPLLVEGRVIGVLHVGTLVRRDFSDEDVQLLQLAADRMAVAIDHARLYEAERSAAEQLRRLSSVTEAALAHLQLDDLLDVLLVRLGEIFGSDAVAVMLSQDEGFETRAALGALHVGESFATRVLAERRPAASDDVLGVPLLVQGEPIGVLVIGSPRQRAFGSADVDLLARAADRIAVAIENARLFESERRAAEQLRRMESIAQVAYHHLSVSDEVLEELLVRVRDVLGTDTAAVLEMDDHEQTLVARASKGIEEFERGVRVPLGAGFAGAVAERRAPVRSSDAAEFDLVSPLLRERGVKSLLGVPLVVEDRVLGVLHVGAFESRAWSDDDLALLELAAERLAVAIDHSRLYEREHAVAETLQRSLLPEHLPDVAGVEMASRYVPGAPDTEVGGDWYDVIPLSGGRVGLAMGDVVSRGVRAASVMGQLRNALRAYALDGRPPGAVLERLHGMLRSHERREMATLAYMVLDPAGLSYALSSAGHPPPLVLAADGGVDLIEEGRGPPLGAVADALYRETTGELTPGTTLLLYTDGLVERRAENLDIGLGRLSAAASEGPLECERLCDRLLAANLPSGATGDDVALLVLCHVPLGSRLALDLPSEPSALRSLRALLRRWLAQADAAEVDVHAIVMACSEACTNAIEHAGAAPDETISFEAVLHDSDVDVVVRDRGHWREGRPPSDQGRGLELIDALMDDVQLETTPEGTTVRLRRSLSERVRV
jgi:GAF domain-containing protein/anti-sigma regulatory factor (Ser/Thr protein kinase)